VERPPLPPPQDIAAPPAALLAELDYHVGSATAALCCADLLDGAEPAAYADVLPYLCGRPAAPFLAGTWGPAYWSRVWGARGLRYVWDDRAAPAVLGGLADEEWRVAEMSVKVAGLRELGPAGDAAARLAAHDRPRVRLAAVRTLAVVGDTEHVEAVVAARDDPDEAVRRAAVRALGALDRRLDRRLDGLGGDVARRD
jgi:hypothetical protein